MRGKGEENRSCQKHCRITPAYAGKSRLATPPTAASRGSPPPMRGKVQDDLCRDQCTEDHPRLCGEKVQACEISKVMKGSPPPMRGKVSSLVMFQPFRRITPAYAGKSVVQNFFIPFRQDHPRLCGEKLDKAFGLLLVWGSPPPMRGKALPFLQDTFPPGITPAYAGKRDGLDELRVLEKDHPRLCGEKSTFTSHILILPGSPPPMRGKAPFRAGWGRRCGITPAYAGKRQLIPTTLTIMWDHPRLCGEKRRFVAG